jgi:hypothetical protein
MNPAPSLLPPACSIKCASGLGVCTIDLSLINITSIKFYFLSNGIHYPCEMGVADVEAFLNWLYKRTAIPRSRMRTLACCTVYSP